jgi:primosomal protein N' (replication factor Y)
MARILFRFPNEAKAMTEAERAANLLSKRIIEQRLPLELIGPAPCFFTREDDHVRWHLIVRGADPVAALRGLNVPSGWHVDVDPVEVL